MIKVYTGATGKMEGTPHISCASGDSDICKTFCMMAYKCYGHRYQNLYPVIKKSYHRNGEMMTRTVYKQDDLPDVNTFQCRFNSFGELFTGDKGVTQLTNYVNIALKNPKTKFGIWSHNYELIESYFDINSKPKNFRIIRSTNGVNVPILEMSELHNAWDGVFNVVTPEFAKTYSININCGEHKCTDCPVKCYTAKGETIANEFLK